MKEKIDFLIKSLLSEREEYKNIIVPESFQEKFKLYRSLVNVREPKKASEEYLAAEDVFLKSLAQEKGITTLSDLTQAQQDIYIWQGDITALAADAIVNAANSQLLGCFYPCHGCIDNAIHTFAGVRLRKKCAEIMAAQGEPEPTGLAKITPAYNLPSKYVIHTVGPIVSGALTLRHEALLESCYLHCLELADEYNLKSIAFCCISTGEFRFPNKKAAHIAVKTVREYKKNTNSKIKVIFNVFKDSDKAIYEEILA